MSLLQDIQEIATQKKAPDVRPGHTVRVHQKIKEGNKERIQIFEGLVIKVNSGHGADKSFTVRKVVDGIGVEKVFPLYSTTINKIEIKKKSKIRRSKLYYMRERSGKSARLKESFVKQQDEEVEAAVEELAAQKAKEEAEKAAETPKEEASETGGEASPAEIPSKEESPAAEPEAKPEDAKEEPSAKPEEAKEESADEPDTEEAPVEKAEEDKK